MRVIGLTGGIGMGKSAAAELLEKSGVPILDTDVLAREVVALGQPALGEIERVFGAQVLHPDGSLRRDELARRVFADAGQRQRLEAILHPRIRERWLAQVAVWRGQGLARIVVVIPLLFETGAEADLDTVICVACSAQTQQHRLRLRNWTVPEIEQRIAAQWPIERKMLHAHFVVWNEGTLELLAAQLQRILSRLAGGGKTVPAR